jgi:hypothetical protein
VSFLCSVKQKHICSQGWAVQSSPMKQSHDVYCKGWAVQDR